MTMNRLDEYLIDIIDNDCVKDIDALCVVAAKKINVWEFGPEISKGFDELSPEVKNNVFILLAHFEEYNILSMYIHVVFKHKHPLLLEAANE